MITGSVLLFGLLFGLQHALEADHLAAVATLVARRNDTRRAVRLGIFWGLGHTATLLAFGGAVLVVGVVLSDRWMHGIEALVGVMLVLLGADLLRRVWRDRVHAQVHGHDDGLGVSQTHLHAHGDGLDARRDGAGSHRHGPLPLRALAVGMVHGLAGSAALALLTIERIASPWVGLLYVLLFGLGSVVGMAALSWAVSVPMRLTAQRLTHVHRWLNASVALFSVAVGVQVVAAQL